MSFRRRAAFFAIAFVATKALLRSRRRMDFCGKTVLISGGSRGLGLEMSRCFAEEGAHLALLARDPEELERSRRELAETGARVLTRACDIGNREEVRESVREVADWSGRIDVVVNNSGMIQVGPFEHMEPADFQDALAVHFWGPLYVMQEVLSYMKRQGEGRIVNIASIGGKVAVPHLLPYSASKFALVGLSDGMRAEMAGYGIRVTTVCPGLMRTGSHENALFKGRHEKEFTIFSICNALPFFSISSRRAARKIVEACRYGDPFLIITPQARLLNLANAFFPGITASAFQIANCLLPRPSGPSGNFAKKGWESHSLLAPSSLTRLSDTAVDRNNENVAGV